MRWIVCSIFICVLWKASLVILCFWRNSWLIWLKCEIWKKMYTSIKLQMCQSNVTWIRINKNDWANTCYVKSGSGRILPIEEWWKEFCSRPQCAEGLWFCFFPSFFSLPNSSGFTVTNWPFVLPVLKTLQRGADLNSYLHFIHIFSFVSFSLYLTF